MPPSTPSTPSAAPVGPAPAPTSEPVPLDTAGRAAYLDQVMGEIDVEVRRRRASGDLPEALERELDDLFLEFSPVGLHGKERLRETLALVDSSAYVDLAVPTASNKAVGSYVKKLIKAGLGWYLGFIVHQIVKFAWSVSRLSHEVVDHLERLEGEVAGLRTEPVPDAVVPVLDAGTSWWAAAAVDAVSGAEGRVLQGDCGGGSLLAALVAAGVDAYGVDASETAIEPALDDGLDVRAEDVVDHLAVVAPDALDGVVLDGSVQWLAPNRRDRLVDLLATRVAPGGVVVLHSATPESWRSAASPVLADLVPARPLHAETWSHLLTARGFAPAEVAYGGDDRRLAKVSGTASEAVAINAAIDVMNQALLGPGEYVLVATRTR